MNNGLFTPDGALTHKSCLLRALCDVQTVHKLESLLSQQATTYILGGGQVMCVNPVSFRNSGLSYFLLPGCLPLGQWFLTFSNAATFNSTPHVVVIPNHSHYFHGYFITNLATVINYKYLMFSISDMQSL